MGGKTVVSVVVSTDFLGLNCLYTYLNPPRAQISGPQVCFWWLRGSNFRPLEDSGIIYIYILYIYTHLYLDMYIYIFHINDSTGLYPNYFTTSQVVLTPNFSSFVGETPSRFTRFSRLVIGIPYQKCTSPGGHYYWEGGQPKDLYSTHVNFHIYLFHILNLYIFHIYLFIYDYIHIPSIYTYSI